MTGFSFLFFMSCEHTILHESSPPCLLVASLFASHQHFNKRAVCYTQLNPGRHDRKRGLPVQRSARVEMLGGVPDVPANSCNSTVSPAPESAEAHAPASKAHPACMHSPMAPSTNTGPLGQLPAPTGGRITATEWTARQADPPEQRPGAGPVTCDQHAVKDAASRMNTTASSANAAACCTCLGADEHQRLQGPTQALCQRLRNRTQQADADTLVLRMQVQLPTKEVRDIQTWELMQVGLVAQAWGLSVLAVKAYAINKLSCYAW